ncbi:MAG: hypothetical protein IBJ03_06315 [Gemmatimonadaceae bacterium]|nr:hypothetical protein [Gemmatimonadaceae bacterium]
MTSAQRGDRPTALRRLDSLTYLPGGLDPSFHRTFLDWHSDTAFQRIITFIRTSNPPIVRSSIAYRIGERDLQPEGIAFDSRSRAVFVGSLKGKIVHVDSAGAVSDFAQVSRADSTRVVVGLRVDTIRGHLWAAVDDPRAFVDAEVAGGALYQYDIASGRLIAQHSSSARGAFNDLIVAEDGVAYATNTTNGSLWRTDTSGTAMREFLPAGTAPGANGIAWDGAKKLLFVASGYGIVRVDLATRATHELINTTSLPLGSFDGLYWFDGGLIGIQNGVHPGRVVRLALDDARERVLRAEILERYHPQFNGMTTAALDGRSLLYLVNTQSRAFRADGSLIEGRVLTDILIARLPLR